MKRIKASKKKEERKRGRGGEESAYNYCGNPENTAYNRQRKCTSLAAVKYFAYNGSLKLLLRRHLSRTDCYFRWGKNRSLPSCFFALFRPTTNGHSPRE